MNRIKGATQIAPHKILLIHNLIMENNQVLIISFWNPTAKHPQQGIFIQEQATAVCILRENVVFLQVNVLPSDQIYLKKTVEESTFYKNKRIIINLYSRFWKLLYVNPWWLAWIVYSILKKRTDKINPAIIHSNVIFPCGIVGYILAKRMGTKLLISEHWSSAEKFLKHLLYRRIALRAYLKSQAIICVSEFLLYKMSKATGHTNLVIIPNIIKTEIFSYHPKPPSSDGRLCLMCVASWRLPKRLDLIFDSLCHYAHETTRLIDLTVVGNGTQVEMLKNRETPDNLQIKWIDYLDRPSIGSMLQKTHFFLHASDIETFSIVTAEALSTGTPVIASNVGALPELINEFNGLLAENTAESWLKCIREIVTKKFDHEAISLQNQNKYSPGNIGNSIIAVYDGINSDLK